MKTSLSQRIKQARLKAGISQAELARRMNISRASVSIWESGGNVSQDNIVRLSKLLRVTPEWLQYEVGARPEVDIAILKDCLVKVDKVSEKMKQKLSRDQYARITAYLYTDELRGSTLDDKKIADLIKTVA
jgi:transcriptional regulator with XRE-family HTH domain